jgi:hypothetical protein
METDPVVYPKIQIGSENVEVKFTCGDIIKLTKDGVDITQFAGATLDVTMERAFKLLSVGISRSIQKTPEDLANEIDLSRFGEVTAAVAGAISKAMAQVTAVTQAANLANAPATKQ